MAVQDQLDQKYIEKLNLVAAVASTDAGISLLQWLVRLTGFSKPIMSLEDASRRDVWLTIRPFVPVEKLSLIEHAEIRQQQEATKEILQRLFEGEGLETGEEDHA
ncbi:MAG: hypothetical protein K2X27_15905 [Candidatus Obscuribacterales bacterium]|nr:hypothetical protein [Candidatus Obscuribacterales bacterium]